MEAPDKIYINGFSAFATEPVKDGIEYIRKDALLEYLNGLDTNSRYEQFVIENLIKHIESL